MRKLTSPLAIFADFLQPNYQVRLSGRGMMFLINFVARARNLKRAWVSHDFTIQSGMRTYVANNVTYIRRSDQFRMSPQFLIVP